MRGELIAELRRVHEQLNMTTVHVTHDHAEARALGDRIGIMADGAILQTAAAEEVFERPANEFVARFLRSWK